ncbi:MAG: hypothetical protein FWF69_06040 [Firmicutes bacterium]|nr:hypothetical protein [Bacillota bacterium]
MRGRRARDGERGGVRVFGQKKLERILPRDEEVEKQGRKIREEMEKGDLPAMILAALLTLWPVLLILGGLMGLLYWWAVH